MRFRKLTPGKERDPGFLELVTDATYLFDVPPRCRYLIRSKRKKTAKKNIHRVFKTIDLARKRRL